MRYKMVTVTRADNTIPAWDAPRSELLLSFLPTTIGYTWRIGELEYWHEEKSKTQAKWHKGVDQPRIVVATLDQMRILLDAAATAKDPKLYVVPVTEPAFPLEGEPAELVCLVIGPAKASLIDELLAKVNWAPLH
jgi:peptidyl-tRNA hydrolase